MNPFLLKGYKSPSYFCNREIESQKILTAVQNQQDITLFALRRIGKSALIHHVFYRLKKNFDCVYADIWGTTSLNGFINEIANAVIQSSVFSKRPLGKKLTDFIRSIGASLSVGFDGKPSVDLVYHDKNYAFKSLEEIFNFLEMNTRPVILAIDEFQEIKKYDHSLEAKLRAIAQRCQNIRFIYSGSEHHLLNEIFSAYNAPFYQSTRMMELKKIAIDEYRTFILKHFNTAKKKIEGTVIDHILTVCYNHTYYVQAICNFLYSQSKLPQTIAEFESLYYEYITEKRVFYSELPQRLSKQQFSTIKAFAQLGLVSAPTSAEFLSLAEVKSASSMQRIIKTLIDKQLIIKEDDKMRIYDVFLEHFLRYGAK
jgi:hypothetical protein